MGDEEKLERYFKSRPILLIDSDRKRAELVKLSRAKEAFVEAITTDSVLPIAKSLEEALRRFREVLRRKGMGLGPYGTADLAMMAEVSTVAIFGWVESGLIQPDPVQSNGRERRYSFTEGFCAGLIGSLRRERCGNGVMKLAAARVREVVTPERGKVKV